MRLALGEVARSRGRPLYHPDASEHAQVLDAGGVSPLRAPAIAGLALDAPHVPGHRQRAQVSKRDGCRGGFAHA